MIITLTRKLPDEGLKRKWVDKAGDLIKSKGRAAYLDFVSFVREAAHRVNNGCEKELKFSPCAERESKESGKGKADYPLKVTPTVKKISRAPPYLPESHWSVHSARDHMESGAVGYLEVPL